MMCIYHTKVQMNSISDGMFVGDGAHLLHLRYRLLCRYGAGMLVVMTTVIFYFCTSKLLSVLYRCHACWATFAEKLHCG